ncbi:hypothetical protein ACEPAI_8983 [Sanghuangporus weigelae]
MWSALTSRGFRPGDYADTHTSALFYCPWMVDSRSLYTPGSKSCASALDTRSRTSRIRHRGLSPRIPQGSSPVTVGSSAAAEADDEALRRPPLLVRDKSSEANISCPTLPFQDQDQSQLDHPTIQPNQQFLEIRESTSFSETVLEAILLTPRPEVLSDPENSESHAKDHDAERLPFAHMSRLPSTAFSAAPNLEARSDPGCASRTSYAGIFDFFRRPAYGTRLKSGRVNSLVHDARSFATSTGRCAARLQDATASSLRSLQNFHMYSKNRLRNHMRMPSLRWSQAGASGAAPQLLQTRSQTASTETSSRTSSSARTYASTSSVDSGRTYLFPGISTTDKFTHRWPVPGGLNKLRRRSFARPMDDFRSIASEEFVSGSFDVGLGFERVGRWTTHKWVLFLSVLSVLGYSIAALVFAILTWYQTWEHAEVMIVADGDVLILTTLCASLLLLAALVGLTGTLLNSRPLLAIYALLLWPAFISLLSVGYVSYKRASFSLDRKLNMAWSKWYTDAGRAVIQDSLRCCGFSDPTHEAVYGPGFAGGCYARTLRPGCKGPLLRFERANLGSLWRAVFSAVPLHIINIIICLLCANHVTRTFGTGLLPRAYRLKLKDVKTDAKSLLEHFVSGNEKDGNESGDAMSLRAMRYPPSMARTESGVGVRREDKVYAYTSLDDDDTEDLRWRRVR